MAIIKEGQLLRDARIIQARLRRRMAESEYASVPKALVPQHLDVGWVVDRELLRSTRVHRAKAHDIAFEDRVWAMFARLGFSVLNEDRSFRIPYGAGAGDKSQIDVFAANDETVVLVECKSTANARTSSFKTEVEAIQGIRPGVLSWVRREFSGRKVKFILATNNFGLSDDTQQRLAGADIVHFSEETVDYYHDLATHLGAAAQYQLLGALFAGQKIPNLDPVIPAIRGRMGGMTYYSFSIEPSRLLQFAYILHRNKANNDLMPTYQRLIRKSRLLKISSFVSQGGFFPNSIVVNISAPGKGGLGFDLLGKHDGPTRLGMLHLPQTYRSAYVVDGQHRLYGYAGSSRAATDVIPVIAFVDLDPEEQVRLFMQINENQQAVPKNLRSTLNADLLWESTNLLERHQALRLRIAQDLGDLRTSPLYGRVQVGENPKSSLRCITLDAINNGLRRGNFLGRVTKDSIKDPGTYNRGSNEATLRPLLRFLEGVLEVFRDGLASQWALGSAPGGFVFMNNGVEAILRVTSDIVDHLHASGEADPRKDSPKEVLEAARFYIDPLVDFLAAVSPEDAVQYRRSYGSGGGTRYWRRLQHAIHVARPEFNPPGLLEFLADEERALSSEAREMVAAIGDFLKTDVRERLQSHFGELAWYKDGVPRSVREGAEKLMVEKNLDAPVGQEVEAWDCLYLIDYHKILTQNMALWNAAFAARYADPRALKQSWKSQSTYFNDLNRIRNDVAHEKPISEQDLELLASVRSWLVDGERGD